MALTDLTLTVTSGVQGNPFKAKIGGLTTGKLEVLAEGTPGAGFAVLNGFLQAQRLPAAISPIVVVLREYDPGGTPSSKDTRLAITAYADAELHAQAIGALGGGRSLRRYTAAADPSGDGSLVYALKVEDDLGVMQSLVVGSQIPSTPTAYAHVFEANGQPDLWFDASDLSTITSSSGAVDSIMNKGALGGSAFAANTNRPGTGTATINGLNVLDFNGSNHLDMPSTVLSFPAQGYTLLTVFRNDETTTTNIRFLHIGRVGTTISFGAILNTSNFANRISNYMSGSSTATHYNAASNQGLLINGVRGQTSDGVNAGNKVGHAFVSGFEANTTGAVRSDITLSDWSIGRNPANTSTRALGKFCEMIGWRKSLSLDDFQVLEGYLAAKWGLTLGLFAGATHPWSDKDPRSTAYARNIACWGDSFTGESFLTDRWVDRLANLTGRQARNAGIGGQTSTQIMDVS